MSSFPPTLQCLLNLSRTQLLGVDTPVEEVRLHYCFSTFSLLTMCNSSATHTPETDAIRKRKILLIIDGGKTE